MNKLIISILFISFLSSLNLVYGLSDSDFMQRYPTCEKLKSALNTGEIFWSDLTTTQTQVVQTQCQLTPDIIGKSGPITINFPSFKDISDNIIWLPIMAVLIGLPVILIANTLHGRTTEYSEEKTSNKTEDKVTKISMDSSKTKEEHPMGDKTHD